MGTEQVSRKGRRRRLTPQDKYQIWLEVTTGQGTQREIAERWNVDRSTLLKIMTVAKQSALDGLAASRPGRPGKSAAEYDLNAAKAEITRLTETIKEQACELMLLRGKGRWD